LGSTIAIDDFGTGYSSLNYIKRLPLDKLKVDRAFIKDLPDDNDDKQITAAIIAMAHTLNLKVVAEGVETKEQMHFLQTLSCEIGQGYLFDKPISPEEFEQSLLVKNGYSVDN
jgi:EAL domain-containing protein (putative c-di-GMP-specific phosphodiesterase class I)